MSWQWPGPVTYTPDYLYDSQRAYEDKQTLGFDPNEGGNLLGVAQESWDFNPGQFGYPQQPNRPAPALDTNGGTFAPPQYQLPSAPPLNQLSGFGNLPYQDGEQVITPGPPSNLPSYQYPMSFPTSGVAVPPQQPWVPQSYYNIPNLPYPSETFVQQQNTIAPSQLGQDSMLKPSKSFSDLMAEGRRSSSSTDSNEPGQDWIGNALENWTWPMQQALISDPRPKQRRVSKPRINDPGTSFQVQSLQPPVPRPLPFAAGYTDLETTVRQYVFSPNRLAEGERKMVVMTPKVGQKSYGTEKRFLCPHPQAALVGQAWWTRSKDHCPISPIHPPRVNISLIGEQPVKDAGVSWTTIAGHSLDDKTPVTLGDRPFLGNVAGKNLYISDNDAKRRDVKAQVAVKVPFDYHAGPNGWGPSKGSLSDISNDKVLGTFESKEIKVISKPSKKKTNSKSGDLLIPHGSTVALFNRVKSQTASTRYLSVVPDATRILGSDGKHVLGAVPPLPSSTENLFRGFIAHASVWESFIIWLVDLSKPVGPGLNPPLHPDWPRAPSNAIAPSLLAPSIRYNSTVILQSVQTGLCSPILVLRRVEQDAEVVGGDGTSSEMSAAHPEGEQLGDLVSQLQKIAFEVYSDSMVRSAGLWLACDQDEVVEKSVHADRKWSAIASSQSRSRPSSVSSTPNQRFGVLPMTPHTGSVNLPSTPSSPNSNTSSLDYFGSHSRKASSSSLMSPISSDAPLPSTDGGPIRRQRTGSASRGPLGRPAHKKRQSADSATSSFEHLQNAYPSTGDVPKFYWSLDVGDVCVWSIVSTEQTTYTFYVPSHVKEIDQPIAPFPMANRILLPNAPMDMGPASMKMHSTFTSRSDAPLITIYGKHFNKRPDHHADYRVYYGHQPASYNEVRCTEVMASAVPERPVQQKTPIFLVRENGQCILPTNLVYP